MRAGLYFRALFALYLQQFFPILSNAMPVSAQRTKVQRSYSVEHWERGSIRHRVSPVIKFVQRSILN